MTNTSNSESKHKEKKRIAFDRLQRDASLRMVKNEKARKEQEEQVMKECTFKPSINQRKGSKRLESQKRNKEQRCIEEVHCTFKPEINPKSVKLLETKN